jgi:hypothetical protein
MFELGSVLQGCRKGTNIQAGAGVTERTPE